jgi:anti-anti-sigma factor
MTTRKIPVPPVRELSISTEKWRDWNIVHLDGKFVVQSFALVRSTFDAIETGTAPNAAIDMGGIAQIDSSALTIILNFQKRLEGKHGKLAIFGPNAIIKDTLMLVGFNKVVPVFSTRAMFEQSAGSP